MMIHNTHPQLNTLDNLFLTEQIQLKVYIAASHSGQTGRMYDCFHV